MIPFPDNDAIEKGRALHDKIKSHPFRLEPQLGLLDEFHELIEGIHRLYSMYEEEKYVGGITYYKYHRTVKEPRSDEHGSWTAYIDVWSNPTIAIINLAMHDCRGIHWSLKANWDCEFWRKKYLSKYIETTEVLLQLLHKLIDGETVAEVSLPTERIHYNKEDDYTRYKYVRSPYYDNDWVLESTHRRKENEKLTGEVVEK